MTAVYRQLAVCASKIVRGASPSELPIEQPTKFELVANAKTAKALSLAIPPEITVRAIPVIQ